MPKPPTASSATAANSTTSNTAASSSTTSNSAAPAPFPWLGLIALSCAVFLSVTSEMLPTGLLPDMSSSLSVTESQIGLLITVFAFTVVLTSAPLTVLTKKLPRHGLVLAVLVIFAISNVLTAIAPTYEFVVFSRVLGGLAHGLFWAVVGAYAGHLVPKKQIGRAVSIALGGGTLAFVLGVPVGTALGHAMGWRLAFVVLAVVTLAVTVLVWRFLPPVPRVDHAAAALATNSTTDAAGPKATPRPSRRSRRDPTVVAVALVCTITAIVMIGHYSFYTYVAPFIIDGMGLGSNAVGPFLFIYGIAGAVGLILAGWLGGTKPQSSLVIAIVISALSVTALGFFALSLPIAIVSYVLWGIAFGLLPPLMQTKLLHVASPRIRDTASAYYTTGFNIGIGGGALLGGLVYDHAGLATLPFVYVGILLVALTLVLVSGRLVQMPVTGQIAVVQPSS